jgi:hypothetical protein
MAKTHKSTSGMIIDTGQKLHFLFGNFRGRNGPEIITIYLELMVA